MIFDPSELSAPHLQEAFSYWLSKRGSRAMPSRRDIDPVEMPKLLPYLMLIDVIPEPLDFRYRLIGTEVRAISRRDYTGMLFSQLPGKGRGSVVWEGCAETVRACAPFSRTPPYVGPEQHLADCENLLLPLSEDGATVNMIMKVISFRRGL